MRKLRKNLENKVFFGDKFESIVFKIFHFGFLKRNFRMKRMKKKKRNKKMNCCSTAHAFIIRVKFMNVCEKPLFI